MRLDGYLADSGSESLARGGTEVKTDSDEPAAEYALTLRMGREARVRGVP
jgi:hypothetical protein